SSSETGWPIRERIRSALVLAAGVVLAALGLLSVYRQSSSRTASAGFTVVDRAGTIAVTPGDLADAAGLRSGDTLLALGDEPFADPFSWNRALLDREPPSSISAEVLRGSE